MRRISGRWTTLAAAWIGGACLAASLPAAPPPTPAASAKRFVDRLYGVAGPPVPEEKAYTPELARLIDRAAELSRRTDDPDVVGNALCDCQEMEGMRAQVAVVSATPAAASVRVLLTGHIDGPQRILLKLVRVGAEWRIADTTNGPNPSYATYLRGALAGR